MHIISNYQDKGIKLITIGKKGTIFFRKRGYNILKSYEDIYEDLTYPLVSTISSSIINFFLNKDVDEVYFVYNEFVSVIQQRLVNVRILPLDKDLFHTEPSNVVYIYEPSLEAICDALLTKAITIQLFRTLLESYCAELGARMTAMDSATDNATEMIRFLTKMCNRARQAGITQEISEIVGGAEAMKN